MYPYLFDIGNFTVGTFGICMVAGFLISWLLVRTEVARRKLKKGLDVDLLLFSMVGGIIGAKVWYIIEHWSAFILEPKDYIISGGGLVWYGGLVGGFIAACAVMLFHKQSFRSVADTVSPSLAIGLAIGRIG